MKKFTCKIHSLITTIGTVIVIISISFSQLTVKAQGASSAIFPMDFVPHEETLSQVYARETRLINSDTAFFMGYNTAVTNGTVASWVNSYLSPINLAADKVGSTSYYHVVDLFELTKFAIDYNHHELDSILISRLNYAHALCLSTYKVESQNDINGGGTGYPFDLNTVHPANSLLSSAISLKLLGAYNSAVKDSTESFITRFVENKGQFDGFYQTTGYNKEIYLCDIASNVLYLYQSDPTKYPKTKQTFESFWLGLTQASYDGDNSPHYDASTGIWTALRMALLHNRLNDLKIRNDFLRMLTRMAKTVMSNGETAKWSKSMGGPLDGNRQLTNDASDELPWTLKMGYKLFSDPFLLYVARKYEDLRLNGDVASWQSSKRTKIYPVGINYSSDRNVVPTVNTPLSFVTDRLTSKTQYNGLLLGRGDTNTKLVQDKMILSTGRHPRSPFFMMDMSYTQSKASVDQRIGADNLIFDGTHLCTYLDRPGNGNQINRPFLCPNNYTYPLVNATFGEAAPSADYNTKMGFNPSFDYVLQRDSAFNINENTAYGSVEYSKFQYNGVSAKREVMLLHNGILVVLDRMKASSAYAGGHNAGVIYQVWPSIQAQDTAKRWVLQGQHLPTLVDKTANPNGHNTLYYFPQVGSATQASILTDPNLPRNAICKAFSVSKSISANDSVNVLSLVIPVRNTSLVNTLISAIKTSESNGTFTILLPQDSVTAKFITFKPGQVPTIIDSAVVDTLALLPKGILDSLASSPTASYSVRHLRSGYLGAAMRVRRSNDNQLVDVYFDGTGIVSLSSKVSGAGGGPKSSNSLGTWVGSNSAYVTIWYDQSNNNNATQTTTAYQPRIINSGVIESLPNGMPALKMLNGATGGNGFNFTFNLLNLNNINAFFALRQDGNTANGNHLFGTSGPTGATAGKLQIHYYNATQLGMQSSATYGSSRLPITSGNFLSVRFKVTDAASGTGQILTSSKTGATVTSLLTTSLDATALTLFRYGNSATVRNFEGVSPEFIYYGSSLSDADATIIMNNQNNSFVQKAPISGAATAVTTNAFTANWTLPSGSAPSSYTYTLQYSSTSDFSSGTTTIANILSSQTSRTITGLSPNTDYWYRVLISVSGSGGGESGWSVVRTLKTLIIMPISLVDFNVKKTSSGALLNWKTVSESENDYFEIEHSVNGKNFAPISKVNGAGNSSKLLAYNFVDRNPAAGLNYYRLRQVDINGDSDFSNFVSLNYSLSIGDVNIYPNPVADILHIDMATTSEKEFSIKIIDLSGKILKRFNLRSSKVEVNVNDLQSGAYLVEVTDTSTQKRLVLSKFIKQ